MSYNKNEPNVYRRRKILRQQREKTPEPSSIITSDAKLKCSDDEKSATELKNVSAKLTSTPANSKSTHPRRKFTSCRDKAVGTSAIRSRSTPRVECETDKIEVVKFEQPPKRSLSTPRHKEYTLESGPQEEKVPQKCNESKTKTITQLEINLKRFEEERRKFNLEKNKHEIDRRDLTKARFQRLEDFEKKRLKLDGKSSQKNSDKLNTDSEKSELSDVVASRTTSPTKANTGFDQHPVIEKNILPKMNAVSDDYVSSTSVSSSSRDGQFDDIDEEFVKNEKIELLSDMVETTIQPDYYPYANPWVSEIVKITEIPETPGMNKLQHAQIGSQEVLTQHNLKCLIKDLRNVWINLIKTHREEWRQMKIIRNKCLADLIFLFIFCGFGGLIFRFVEGAFENFYKCGVRRVKRDFVEQLWLSSHNLREDDWKTLARNKLRQFEEELLTAHEASMTSYSGLKSWSFINSVNYCLTVVTTIGYGHISPSTNTGRAITIVYAVFGIPMFLILLADFGKLFTRGIKFLWAYVRRLYYTGSCRRVRKQSQVQDVLKGVNFAYEIATFRRPSLMTTKNEKTDIEQPAEHQSADIASVAESPPIDDVEIVIDDEFNLPISLALFILLAYIFFGAAVYSLWEEWSFFESFYFVFISMSTIGFGDYVPKHPMYMMTSIVYLVFGLALTSMCINVVQLKLSDSFRHASAKIGATIGLTMAEEEAKNSQCHTPNDIKEQVEPNTSVDDTKPKEPAAVEPPPLLPRKPTKSVTEDTKANVKKQKGDKKK